MSTVDLTMLLDGLDRGAAKPADTPLRMVLVEGEALRLPLSRMRVRILSGTAWVTQSGRDLLLEAGSSFDFSTGPDRAVISPIGTLPIFFEMC
jgi:hypothetical protein